jgi:SNF2 family DNA or RNA helicase
MIHVSAKHKVVGVPFRQDVANLFQTAKQVDINGTKHIILPHGLEETRVLRNLGLDVPAPVLSHYDWCGGTPFDVQKKTCAMLTTNPRAYVLNGMGTGKTKSALWAFDYLRSNGMANRMLVVAPLSTLNFTWAKEIFGTTPHLTSAILHGSKAKRLAMLEEKHDIYIINHDGLKVIADELKKRADINVMCLDELAVYRSGSSIRTKIVREIAKKFVWVWGMTGSPTPNEPTDAWAQCTIVTPNTVPKYFSRFREDLMQRVTQFKWSPKPDAVNKAFAAMQPSVRYTLDDIMELPELVERTAEIEMGTKQAHIYKEMKANAYAAIASNEITAMNAGAVLNKLLQISAGWVYTRDKDVIALDNENRLSALVDTINATERKVIVFVPFVHALNGIVERLTSEGIDCRAVSGATPKSERDTLFNLFQNSSAIRVIVAHPQCMAHGVTLTSADTIIWFAPTTSLEIFEQANARIRRVGQKHKQLVLMFQSTDVERRMYSRLRSKQKVQNTLLEMFEENS